jgi:type VI secretion system secreted protein Hcp
MGSHFLLTLTLKTQGKFKGQPTRSHGGKGHPILSFGFRFPIEVAVQGGTPTVTGRRRHQTVKITREVDVASPLLWQALMTNEAFPLVDIDIFETEPSGKERHANKITLTDATISEIRPCADPASSRGHAHQVTIDFEEIAVIPAVPSPSLMRPQLGSSGFVFRPDTGARE